MLLRSLSFTISQAVAILPRRTLLIHLSTNESQIHLFIIACLGTRVDSKDVQMDVLDSKSGTIFFVLEIKRWMEVVSLSILRE